MTKLGVREYILRCIFFTALRFTSWIEKKWWHAFRKALGLGGFTDAQLILIGRRSGLAIPGGPGN